MRDGENWEWLEHLAPRSSDCQRSLAQDWRPSLLIVSPQPWKGRRSGGSAHAAAAPDSQRASVRWPLAFPAVKACEAGDDTSCRRPQRCMAAWSRGNHEVCVGRSVAVKSPYAGLRVRQSLRAPSARSETEKTRLLDKKKCVALAHTHPRAHLGKDLTSACPPQPRGPPLCFLFYSDRILKYRNAHTSRYKLTNFRSVESGLLLRERDCLVVIARNRRSHSLNL